MILSGGDGKILSLGSDPLAWTHNATSRLGDPGQILHLKSQFPHLGSMDPKAHAGGDSAVVRGGCKQWPHGAWAWCLDALGGWCGLSLSSCPSTSSHLLCSTYMTLHSASLISPCGCSMEPLLQTQ